MAVVAVAHQRAMIATMSCSLRLRCRSMFNIITLSKGKCHRALSSNNFVLHHALIHRWLQQAVQSVAVPTRTLPHTTSSQAKHSARHLHPVAMETPTKPMPSSLHIRCMYNPFLYNCTLIKLLLATVGTTAAAVAVAHQLVQLGLMTGQTVDDR